MMGAIVMVTYLHLHGSERYDIDSCRLGRFGHSERELAVESTGAARHHGMSRAGKGLEAGRGNG